MLDLNFEIHFKKLPLWKGVIEEPSIPEFYPFSLGWNERYICQTTSKEILRQVVKSYSKNDYQLITSPPGTSSWGNSRGNIALEYIRNSFGSLNGKKVLDIGGGTTYIGEKLLSMDNIIEYTIMDPALSNKPPTPKIKIFRQYFTSETCPKENFDLIVSMNCFEHVPDPIDFLHTLRQLIQRQNGKAILLFPDTEKQLRNGDFNVILHEHLSYFTRKSFINLADFCGLKIIDCASDNDLFFFTLGVKQKIAHNVRTIDNILFKAAEQFAQNFEYFNNMVISLINDNKKVALHGACNGLNNLLALCKFPNRFYDHIYVFDGDENKTGKYLSVCPNPIISADDSKYREIDCVIVSAMSFYNQIRDFLISYHGIDSDNIYSLYPFKNE
ncbi:hypothetical protein BuS5_02378 [Desulfosarcina sp. BuS5]|uniref:class I SAM-dependent methyltransferase n=1 Tax=Desulfosarcina sp. BuS5 TaxID=933262 RepID=UPI0004808517|nr:class I SAM-dependent methyltransferase [Desulfosarcina sp. BuS5]WDN89410.1 hypothetical protein BuS5_02378 [Desulfosarcina sp. BuS5]